MPNRVLSIRVSVITLKLPRTCTRIDVIVRIAGVGQVQVAQVCAIRVEQHDRALPPASMVTHLAIDDQCLVDDHRARVHASRWRKCAVGRVRQIDQA